MDCDKTRERLQGMGSGHDLGDDQAFVEAHLMQCSACREFQRRESEIASFLPDRRQGKESGRPNALIALVLLLFALYSGVFLLSAGSRDRAILTQEEKLITEFIVSWKEDNLLRMSDRIDASNFVMIMAGISETRIKSVDRIALKEREPTAGTYADIGRFNIEGKLENDSTFDYTVTLGQRRDGSGLFLISID